MVAIRGGVGYGATDSLFTSVQSLRSKAEAFEVFVRSSFPNYVTTQAASDLLAPVLSRLAALEALSNANAAAIGVLWPLVGQHTSALSAVDTRVTYAETTLGTLWSLCGDHTTRLGVLDALCGDQAAQIVSIRAKPVSWRQVFTAQFVPVLTGVNAATWPGTNLTSLQYVYATWVTLPNWDYSFCAPYATLVGDVPSPYFYSGSGATANNLYPVFGLTVAAMYPLTNGSLMVYVVCTGLAPLFSTNWDWTPGWPGITLDFVMCASRTGTL